MQSCISKGHTSEFWNCLFSNCLLNILIFERTWYYLELLIFNEVLVWDRSTGSVVGRFGSHRETFFVFWLRERTIATGPWDLFYIGNTCSGWCVRYELATQFYFYWRNYISAQCENRNIGWFLFPWIVGIGRRNFWNLTEHSALWRPKNCFSFVDSAQIVNIADIGTGWLVQREALIFGERPHNFRGRSIDRIFCDLLSGLSSEWRAFWHSYNTY